MIGRISLAVCALSLTALTGVSAQQVVTGTVVRIDHAAGVVVLDSGRMYQMTPQTVVIIDGAPGTLATIPPGTQVMLQSAEPVTYRDGRYVMTKDAAPGSPYEVSGVVRWMGASEPGRSSLTLEGGRHIWIDESTQVLANGVPVIMSTLRPGTFVVVRSARPFTFAQRDAVSPAAPPFARDRSADMGAAASPSAMPGTVYRDSGRSVVPIPSYPPHPEVGLRERESERQAP
jgi:hypothetical protein